jgi:hypothetical protein
MHPTRADINILDFPQIYPHSNSFINLVQITGCISESGNFATLFFLVCYTGADAAIAILLPTLKRFSCNGAVDWSTTYFCCESVLQKR